MIGPYFCLCETNEGKKESGATYHPTLIIVSIYLSCKATKALYPLSYMLARKGTTLLKRDNTLGRQRHAPALANLTIHVSKLEIFCFRFIFIF